MDGTLWALISECMNLEYVVIEDCVGLDNVKIHSSKLNELSLQYIEDEEEKAEFELCPPILCFLSIIRFVMGKFSLKDSLSLVEANVWYKIKHFEHWSMVVRPLRGVKRLTTQNTWLELLASKDVLSRSFDHLKHLMLEMGYTKNNDSLGLAAFLELCPTLETMILDYDVYQTDEEEMLPMDFFW